MSGPPPLVRPATRADLEIILGLEAAAFADPWTLAQLLAELEEPRAVVLLAFAEQRAPATGYAALRHAGGQSEILRLAVAPEARRRGIATALVRRGLSEIHRVGAEIAFLEVRADNRSAIALYRGLGFTDVGLRRAYYRDGCDALVLSRLIP